MIQSKPKIRLYIPQPFSPQAGITLPPGQAHYLAHVMRLGMGDAFLAFNGTDGEWRAEVALVSKKQVTVRILEQLSKQPPAPDLWLAFAPIRNKTDIVVEKAVELGVSRIITVITRHAVVRSVNFEKLVAHAVEAAEQCERCDVPSINESKDLAELLGAWPSERTLLWADESGGGKALAEALRNATQSKYGILIGPEGGFAAEEQEMLKNHPCVKPFSMGPRILRADTAAVAALACVQSVRGDWDMKPHFEAQG